MCCVHVVNTIGNASASFTKKSKQSRLNRLVNLVWKMSAYSSAGGSLKLKGVGDLGSKKKKKKKKESKKMLEQITSSRGDEEKEESNKSKRDIRTPAQKAFDKIQEQRQMVRILDKASKKHKERVNEFNAKLDTLTEHFDIPKVSWTK